MQIKASDDRSTDVHALERLLESPGLTPSTRHRIEDSVAINAQGEWTRSYRGREYGVPSPIEQNRKHLDVLEAVFKSGAVTLPRRAFFTMRPELRSLILVSNNCVIKRPRGRIDGIDSVIKAERLKADVFDTWDDRIRTTVQRLVSTATIERIGRELVKLHCGGPTTFAEVAFCRYNRNRFRGRLLCRACQAAS